jgi:hypothetical protein
LGQSQGIASESVTRYREQVQIHDMREEELYGL